jgi:hypothetical protein
VFVLCVRWNNVEQGVAKIVCVELRELQVRKALFDAPEIWRSGGYSTGVKICVTRSSFERINFWQNSCNSMQEWISPLAYTEGLHKPCYGRFFWDADRASWPLSPYNLAYFAIFWFNISIPTTLLLIFCSSMTIEQDFCDMIRCQNFFGICN